MARIIRKTCRVDELPPAVVAGLDTAPDQEVRVTVDARRRCQRQRRYPGHRRPRASRDADLAPVADAEDDQNEPVVIDL